MTIPAAPCVGQGTVAGSVTGMHGYPYSGVKVLVTCSCDMQYGESAVPDAQGYFAIAGVPAGGGINVIALQPDGTIMARGTGMLVSNGQLLTIELTPPLTAVKPE